MSATTNNTTTTTTSLQSLQTEIVELRNVVKDQTEQLKRNEMIIAQLVNTLHGSDASPTFVKNTANEHDKEDDDEYYSNEESDDEDDDDEDDGDEENDEFRNHSYEKRLDYLEKFVFELEQKFTEMEKRHNENRK